MSGVRVGADVEEDRGLRHIKHKVAPVNQRVLKVDQQKTNYPVNINKQNGKAYKKAMKRQFTDLQIAD